MIQLVSLYQLDDKSQILVKMVPVACVKILKNSTATALQDIMETHVSTARVSPILANLGLVKY